jgi:hypothetical protein
MVTGLATVSDTILAARLEWLDARTAVGKRDDTANRDRLEAARLALDNLFDAAHDCE